MSEWKEYKLSDIMDVIGGGTPKTTIKEYWDGDIPWLSVTDFNNGRKYCSNAEKKITKKGLKESSTKILKKGQIIISARGTVGVISMLGRDMAFNQSNYGIDAIKELTTNDFLYYLLKFNIPYFHSHSYGAVFDTITKETFDQICISIPSLIEQNIIASVLSSLDDKIDLLHRQNKTLEAMAETLFRKWFTEETEKSSICQISDLVEFNPNRKLSKGLPAPYLEMGNVNTSVFHPSNWYLREFSSGMKFINGDTLLARITPCLENGKSTYVTFLDEGQIGWGSTEFIVMRSKRKLHPLFTYALAKNRDFRDYAEGCLEGSSGRQRVNVNHLSKYEVCIPEDEIKNKFNKILEAIEPKFHNNFLQIRTLEKLRDALLPKLMSGEVRVVL